MINNNYEINPLSRIICGKWEGELETADTSEGKEHRLNLTIGALSWRALTGSDLTREAEDQTYDHTKFEWIMESQLNEVQRSICEDIFDKMPHVFNNFVMVRFDIREAKERNNNDNEPKKMKIRQSHRLIFNKEGLKRASNYFCESLQGTNDNDIPGFIYITKPKFDIKIKSKMLLNFLEHINDPENLTIKSENFYEIYSLSIFYGSKEVTKKCLGTKVNYSLGFFNKQLDILVNSKNKTQTQLDFLCWTIKQDSADDWIKAWENYCQSPFYDIQNITNGFDPKEFAAECRGLYEFQNALECEIERFGSSYSFMHVICVVDEINANTYKELFEKFGAYIDSIVYINEIEDVELFIDVSNNIANNIANLKVLEAHNFPLIPATWLNSIEGLVLINSNIESLILLKVEHLRTENCFELKEIQAENLVEASLLVEEEFLDQDLPELQNFIAPQLEMLTVENVNFWGAADKTWMDSVEKIVLKNCNLTKLTLKKAETLIVENCFLVNEIEGDCLLEMRLDNGESRDHTTLYGLVIPNIEDLSMINIDFSNMENPFIWNKCTSLNLCNTKRISEVQVAETAEVDISDIDPSEKIEVRGTSGKLLYFKDNDR